MRIAALLFFASTTLALGELARPPKQPKTGPGGAEYWHASCRVTTGGELGNEYWLFQPNDPAPEGKAPLVIFLHGFSVMEPDGYMGWIEHLVRRGNIVVYPRYQENLRTRPADYLPNTLAALRQALIAMNDRGRIAPDLDRVAVVGHSAGAVLALRYAACAADENLPVPKAAVIVQPGQGPHKGIQLLPLPAQGTIPENLKLVVAVGDSDSIVGEGSARRIWTEAASVKDRLFVTVQTDLHGEPHLRAGHLSPMALDRDLADAHDWYGWWKMFDAACEAAFSGKPLQLDPAMGQWSDGRPMKPLKIERPTPP